MHHVKVCRHPDPWCWPLPRLPAAVWPHHSTPYCTPHAMQSSLNMRVNKSGKRVPCKKKKSSLLYAEQRAVFSPAKSFTFTSAPSLMSSLMRRTSPRIAALCSRVSPLSLRLLTLSLVLDAEFGVPFWPRLDWDWCFGVVSVGRDETFHDYTTAVNIKTSTGHKVAVLYWKTAEKEFSLIEALQQFINQ